MNTVFNNEITYKGVHISVKREDLIHPFISGNKYRKLKYNLEQAKIENKGVLLSFGGAYSNHIAALSYAGKLNGLKTIGVIRGEELALKENLNPTLSFAKQNEMYLHYVSRSDYKNKTNTSFISELKHRFGDFYLVPEGGTNALAVKGCEEILTKEDCNYDIVCCAVGTGGTICGLINSIKKHQKVIGFPALKGEFLQDDIRKFAKQDLWELNTRFHFGGYGKVTSELINFINWFKLKYNIPLDPIYTGKMMYGIFELIDNGELSADTKILVIHTGGLQGIEGMNEKLKRKGLQVIQ